MFLGLKLVSVLSSEPAFDKNRVWHFAFWPHFEANDCICSRLLCLHWLLHLLKSKNDAFGLISCHLAGIRLGGAQNFNPKCGNAVSCWLKFYGAMQGFHFIRQADWLKKHNTWDTLHSFDTCFCCRWLSNPCHSLGSKNAMKARHLSMMLSPNMYRPTLAFSTVSVA